MKACCRFSDSAALQLGCESSSRAAFAISGYKSTIVRRRIALWRFRRFKGWPKTNWPVSALLPISSEYRIVDHDAVTTS